MSCASNWAAQRASLPEKIEEWLRWDKNEETCNELNKLAASPDNQKLLEDIMLKRIEFGTAGLRGKMYVGYACMNDLVIVQTGQGFLRYLEKKDKELLQKNGIVIGYDGRYNSKHWAELTAAIFLHAGYPVKLFGMVVPTPYIPFSVRKYKCASGIMVTASHNPKEDNGYKVYGPNSAQIIPPADKEIQKSIMENLEPWPTSWDKSVLNNNPLLSDPLGLVTCNYLGVILQDILPEFKEINLKQKLLITHTAMHGVATPYVKKVFDGIGITFQTVPEQQDPDPEFPTVKFPNPEEGKSSLDLAFRTADQQGSVVILANDPDADRLACAEKQMDKNEWKVFTGNELGALLGWWMLFQYRKKNPGKSLENVYMICSTVSSMILRTMATAEGFQFLDTLTGFKWIGNKALELQDAGKTVLFCFEEAIGFMTSTAVVDKDGVSGAYQLATCASYLYSQGKTLNQQLQDVYDLYGQHVSLNSYYICHDPVLIKKIFDKIRTKKGPNTYPESICNGKYQITSVRDLTTGYDNNQPDNKAVLPVSSSSQMITFNFSNGLVCTLRTSGTEPKIKYYTEMCASPDIKDRTQIVTTLEEMVAGICEEMLQPKENGLQARAE
nr:unnamed protein product [Callosobruchus analis]